MCSYRLGAETLGTSRKDTQWGHRRRISPHPSALPDKLPKALKAHPLPRPLVYKLPVLKQYEYVKFKDQVLIVNPMTKEIVDVFSQG